MTVSHYGFANEVALFALRIALRTVTALAIVSFAAVSARLSYNVFLHPLRSYPGPKLWAATRLPWIFWNIKGKLAFKIHELHQQYGPVIRIGPNELSYSSGSVWKQIYGHRPDGEMPKDLRGSGLVIGEKRAPSIINSDRENHARMRKLISHAFSERALRDQEGYLHLYVDKFINGLRKTAHEGPQDMVKWFNWTTFDMIGDLAFGEPFGSLDNTCEDPWVSMIFASVRVIPFMQALVYYGVLRFSKYFIPRSLNEKRNRMAQNANDKVDRRLRKAEDRKDFLSFILRHNDEKGMSVAELHSSATVFIIGGSETTATLLSGATYCLLKNKNKYLKLVDEVRGRFQKESDITIQAVAELKYMLAVLDEALRYYPPAPASLPRVVPGDGEVVEGRWVPGGTTVGIHQYSTYRSPANFHAPNTFVPERWLPEAICNPSSPYYNDDRAAFQPFSYGARNCIGRNLAYAEMRLILARLLWNFDLELAVSERPDAKNDDWIEQQEVYIVWNKVPLMVYLRPVAR